MQRVIDFAEEKLAQYGLHGWQFKLTIATQEIGQCWHDRRQIELSKVYAPYIDWRDIILHEIAHALVGEGKGHGKEWRIMCQHVGAKPRPIVPASEIPDEVYRYKVYCPSCGECIRRGFRPMPSMANRFSTCCFARLEQKHIIRGKVPELV